MKAEGDGDVLALPPVFTALNRDLAHLGAANHSEGCNLTVAPEFGTSLEFLSAITFEH